jgi:chemotaxis protein methyltransferase CheR
MRDAAGAAFLQWALPHLGLRWPGFRRVRKQVFKRIDRRCQALGLPDVAAYQAYLDAQPDEWTVLATLCRISISRFYRDRVVFDRLGEVVLPALAESALAHGEKELRCWSLGCASGEEPYTLSLIWRLSVEPRFPALNCQILATDADAQLLRRAETGRYPASSLRELPPTWREQAFTYADDAYRLADKFRVGVEFRQQDIRQAQPAGPFDLILCRNLVFTYFEATLQRQVLGGILQRLRQGGVLVIGKKEELPDEPAGITPWLPALGIYHRVSDG